MPHVVVKHANQRNCLVSRFLLTRNTVRNVVERQWQHHNQLESSGSKETVITLSKPPEYVPRMFEPALIWGSSWQCQQDTALWHPCLKPTAAKTLYQVTQRKRCDLKTLLHQTCLRANIWSPQNKIDLFSAPQKFREIQASTAKTCRWQNFGTPLTGIFVSRHQLNSG